MTQEIFTEEDLTTIAYAPESMKIVLWGDSWAFVQETTGCDVITTPGYNHESLQNTLAASNSEYSDQSKAAKAKIRALLKAMNDQARQAKKPESGYNREAQLVEATSLYVNARRTSASLDILRSYYPLEDFEDHLSAEQENLVIEENASPEPFFHYQKELEEYRNVAEQAGILKSAAERVCEIMEEMQAETKEHLSRVKET